MTHNANKNSTFEPKTNGHITADYRRPNFAILGSCIPQDQKLVDGLCNHGAGTNYSQDTKQVESGQRTMDIIRSALDSLPGLKTLQTPPNSKADVVWKWDLILEYGEYLYPIQVKSGVDDIRECEEALSDKIEEISEEIDDIQKFYENKIESIMDNNDWETRENKYCYPLEKECNEKVSPLKERLENRKSRLPLFVWAAEDEETVVDLVRAFAQLFSVQGDLITFETIAVKEYRKTKPETPIQKTLREKCLERARLSEIHSLLEKSHAARDCSLGKSTKLEDIVSTQIVKNVLTLTESRLNYLSISIEEIERGIVTPHKSPIFTRSLQDQSRLPKDQWWNILCEKIEKYSKFDSEYKISFPCDSSDILQLAKKYLNSLRYNPFLNLRSTSVFESSIGSLGTTETSILKISGISARVKRELGNYGSLPKA